MRLSGIAFAFVASSSSFAAVLFSQPNSLADGYISDNAAYGPGVTFYEQAMADDFSLGTASTINQIIFWGSSENAFTPGLGNFVGFRVEVFSSSFTSLFVANPTTASLSPVATGNLNSVNGIEYKFTLNTSLSLAAGSYWLHVGAFYAAPLADAFVWSSYTSGNGTSAYKDLSVGGPFTPTANAGLDQAFELRGDAVPEPATLAVLGMGAATLMRRRRR